ncbi:hypothetical protein EDD37DRAFT_650828 [Exophiala viscosa]|uniref:uncharacterized protein n=1 Tax=Exophiala viscosa TaxID=2486360 RepID=UPI00219B234F|nr:hypothetical protein EDD37DRAFT_650828 [Exophiala viscosa]
MPRIAQGPRQNLSQGSTCVTTLKNSSVTPAFLQSTLQSTAPKLSTWCNSDMRANTNLRLHLDAKYRPSNVISANSRVLAIPDLPLPNILHHQNVVRDLPQQAPTTLEIPVDGFLNGNGNDDYVAPTYLKVLGGVVLALIFVTVMSIYIHSIYTMLTRAREERRTCLIRQLSSDELGLSSTESDLESDMDIRSDELTPLQIDWLHFRNGLARRLSSATSASSAENSEQEQTSLNIDWLYFQPETLRRHARNLAQFRAKDYLGGPVLFELCGCQICRYTYQKLGGSTV